MVFLVCRRLSLVSHQSTHPKIRRDGMNSLVSSPVNWLLSQMQPPASCKPRPWSSRTSTAISDKAYRQGAWAELKKKVNDHLVEKGVEPIPDDSYMLVQMSPHLVSAKPTKWSLQSHSNLFSPVLSCSLLFSRTFTATRSVSIMHNNRL